MSIKTIETRAVISAQDKTGATSAQVAQKLRGLESAAAAVSKRMDSMTRGMSGSWQAQQQRADIARRMSSVNAVTTSGFFAMSAAQRERALETAARAGAAVAVAAPIVKKIVRQAAARMHENLRMETSGMSAAEIADAQGQMSKMGRSFPVIGNTQIGSIIRSGRTVVGDYKQSVEAAETLLKLGVVLKHVSKGLSDEGLTEQMDALIRAADLAGMTKNVKSLATFVDGIGRSLQAFGDSVKPVSYFQAAQRAGAAASNWSPEFISGPLTSMIQTMQGDPAGTALGTLFSALITGKMKTSAAKSLMELGLLDPKKVKFNNKTGEVQRVLPGGVIGSDLLMSNPYEWSKRHFAPALQKRGIVDPLKVTEIAAGAFSDKKAAQAMVYFLNQRDNIERDINLGRGAQPTNDAVKNIQAHDPYIVMEGITKSVQEIGRALGQDFTPKLVDHGVKLTDTMNHFSQALDRSPMLRAGTIVGGGATAMAATHLGLSYLGGFFGGPGAMASLAKLAPMLRIAGPAGVAAWIGDFAYTMRGNYRLMSGILDRGDAMMRDNAVTIDRSPAALANRIAIRDMASNRNLGGFDLGFGFGRRGMGNYSDGKWKKGEGSGRWQHGWAHGDDTGSVAPGKLAFGFGEFGVNGDQATSSYSRGRGALNAAPRNLAAELRAAAASMAEALRSAPPQKVEVSVSAEPMRVDVQASGELVAIANGAKAATREAKLSARFSASGPGSIGSTDFGNQR